MKKLIITCITRNYDRLKDPKTTTSGWDLVCLTDTPSAFSSKKWQIQEYKGDNRKPKILTHELFPDYDVYLWVDGSIQLQYHPDKFLELMGDADMMTMKHPSRSNAKNEIAHCIREVRGNIPVLKKQYNDYVSLKIPNLYQMGIHIKRNNDKVHGLMRAWWQQWAKYPSRDQPGFSYAMYFHSHGVKLRALDCNEIIKYAYIHPHARRPLIPWDSVPRVHYISPFSVDKNTYGQLVNDTIDRLPDNEWICLLDQDVLFLNPDDKVFIQEIVTKYPDTALFGCMTNRLGLDYQVADKDQFDNPDIGWHKNRGQELRKEFGYEAEVLDKQIAGFFMLFNKEVWRQIKFNTALLEGNEFFDWKFSSQVLARGGTVRLIKGLYVFHLYRFGEKNPKRAVKHLMG